MQPQRYARIKSLFLEAAELSVAQRAALLDRACGDDAALRGAVQRLLEADDGEPPDSPGALPERIGRYRILGLLGAGGMGAVYEAEQDAPCRRVALKVVRPGMATASLLRRLEHEADVLGRLQHPCIAQIFEAGTADTGAGPQPYFAMEYVRGEPLLTFAERHGLDTVGRLELLARLCDGVEHAHQKGVIHRDLKPANVLVEWIPRDGQAPLARPKILDFGVARLVDGGPGGRTLHTTVGQLIGTLPYMSPEQVAGDPRAVDTRADVYALGVLGYELLSGRLPYDLRHQPLPEAARIIAQQPPRPLELPQRGLRADLETILRKALAKERERRYASASDLAADLRRCLRNEPIAARPPTARYHLRQFARRHPGLVSSLSAITLLLVAGIVGTSYGLLEARRKQGLAETRLVRAQQAEAEARRKQAETEAVSLFMLRMLTTARPDAEGRDTTVLEALEVARREVEGAFPDAPAIRAAVHAELGAAYATLGQGRKAVAHLRTAYELRSALLGPDHAETLTSLNNLAFALMQGGEPAHLDEAERLLLDAATLPDAAGTARARFASLSNLANIRYNQGDRAAARGLTQAALELGRRRFGEHEPELLQPRENLALLDEDLDARERELRAILALRRAQGPRRPATLDTMRHLADTLRLQKRYAEADAAYEEAIAAMEEVLGPSHPSTLAAMHQCALARLRIEGEPAAEALLRETLARERAALGDRHGLTRATRSVLAEVLLRRGDFAGAVELYGELADLCDEQNGAEEIECVLRRAWAAVCQADAGDEAGAAANVERVCRIVAADGDAAQRVAPLLDALEARELTRAGHFEQAEALLLELDERMSVGHYNRAVIAGYLVDVYEGWGRGEAAARWREEARRR